jgi:hypothetical protein
MNKFLTKAAVAAAAAGALATVGVAGAGAAGASTLNQATLMARHAPVRVATGSVGLTSPTQYERFTAIQGSPYHGAVRYTNFTAGEAGSGVWAPESAPHAVSFQLNGVGTPYVHTLNGGLVLRALSNNRVAFSGTGKYTLSPQTWAITGQVNGDHVSFTIRYDASTYVVNGTGTIAPDGSASGNATAPGQTLTWAMPAGSFDQVLSYTAPVQTAHINLGTRTVNLSFTIPASVPTYGGIHVTESAQNNGSVLTIDGGNYPVQSGFISVP